MSVRFLQIRVKPNARAASLVEQADGSWLASLRAPPIDGKANAELVALVAQRFGCPQANVKLKAGAGGRVKRVKVETAD